MPGADGKLTAEEKERVKSHIQTWLGKGLLLPVQNGDWIIGDELISPPIFSGGNMILGGPVYPHVMLVERKTGLTLYFNAVLLGLVPPVQPKTKETSGG